MKGRRSRREALRRHFEEHATTADKMLRGCLGRSDAFDKAIAAFSIAYADQSEHDHAILKKGVHSGRVQVVEEPE